MGKVEHSGERKGRLSATLTSHAHSATRRANATMGVALDRPFSTARPACPNSQCALIKLCNQSIGNDVTCLHHLWNTRFGTLKQCPKCSKRTTFHKCRSKKAWGCARCAHLISPTAGTIFHKSSTELSKWYAAIAEMSASPHGVSAAELQRLIGCTYKTAWRMVQNIRAFFLTGDFYLYFVHPTKPYQSIFGKPINNTLLKRQRQQHKGQQCGSTQWQCGSAANGTSL